jgi:hypothetical protein
VSEATAIVHQMVLKIATYLAIILSLKDTGWKSSSDGCSVRGDRHLVGGQVLTRSFCVCMCAPRGSEGDKMVLMNKEDFTQVRANQ